MTYDDDIPPPFPLTDFFSCYGRFEGCSWGNVHFFFTREIAVLVTRERLFFSLFFFLLFFTFLGKDVEKMQKGIAREGICEKSLWMPPPPLPPPMLFPLFFPRTDFVVVVIVVCGLYGRVSWRDLRQGLG